MTSVRNHIQKALFYNSQGGSRMVPVGIVVANCRLAGYEEATVRDELAAMVADGELCEADGHYARATEPGDEPLDIETYRGSDSTPWQFSLTLTADELVVRQARGPPEKFDPVVKRFTVEERPLDDDPLEVQFSVDRRVWQEDPDQPQIKSHRSEGHIVELFYRDPTGRHLTRPDPADGNSPPETNGEFVPTGHPGVTVSATYLRAEEETETKYTGEREYRITEDILDGYAEVYVLTYHEVDEESFENDRWEIADAVAHRLVPAPGR